MNKFVTISILSIILSSFAMNIRAAAERPARPFNYHEYMHGPTVDLASDDTPPHYYPIKIEAAKLSGTLKKMIADLGERAVGPRPEPIPVNLSFNELRALVRILDRAIRIKDKQQSKLKEMIDDALAYYNIVTNDQRKQFAHKVIQDLDIDILKAPLTTILESPRKTAHERNV